MTVLIDLSPDHAKPVGNKDDIYLFAVDGHGHIFGSPYMDRNEKIIKINEVSYITGHSEFLFVDNKWYIFGNNVQGTVYHIFVFDLIDSMNPHKIDLNQVLNRMQQYITASLSRSYLPHARMQLNPDVELEIEPHVSSRCRNDPQCTCIKPVIRPPFETIENILNASGNNVKFPEYEIFLLVSILDRKTKNVFPFTVDIPADPDICFRIDKNSS